MAEAGGGRSGSGPARPPEWGRGGEEARSREGLGGAEGRGRSREGRGADVRRQVPGRGRGRIRGGPEEPAGRRPTRVPGPACLPLAPGRKCRLLLPRLLSCARVSAALPEPRAASARRFPGSQKRSRRDPGRGQGQQQVQLGTPPRPLTGSACKCDRSGRGGLPSSAADAPVSKATHGT